MRYDAGSVALIILLALFTVLRAGAQLAMENELWFR